jgi:hypothetical protein
VRGFWFGFVLLVVGVCGLIWRGLGAWVWMYVGGGWRIWTGVGGRSRVWSFLVVLSCLLPVASFSNNIPPHVYV